MDQKSLNFQSQNLVVDWIEFNIEGFHDVEEIQKTARNFIFQFKK